MTLAPLFTLDEAAASVKIPVRLMRRAVKSGRISHITLAGQVRIHPDDLLDWIRRNRRELNPMSVWDEKGQR